MVFVEFILFLRIFSGGLITNMTNAPKLLKKAPLDNKKTDYSSFIHFVAVLAAAVAVLVITVIVLVAMYCMGIVGGGDRNMPIVFEHRHHTFRLLYFAAEGDLERLSVQWNNSVTVFTIREGITVGIGDNDSCVVFWEENTEHAAPPLLVDLARKRISRAASVARVGDVLETSGEANVASLAHRHLGHTLLDGGGVQIAAGGALPLELTRRGPHGAQVTIQPKTRTIVLERRGSDELRLLLGQRPASTRSMQLRLQQRNESYQTVGAAQLWEEMTFWPLALNISAVNVHGTFEFRNEESILINSYSQGNFSGSPFKHKFARMTDFGRSSANHGFMEMDFGEDDCGRGLYRNAAGNEHWLWLKAREAGLRLPDGGGALEWKNNRVETSDGALRVDLTEEKVELLNATVDNRTKLCDRWTSWNASDILVRIQNNCTNSNVWKVSTPVGKLSAVARDVDIVTLEYDELFMEFVTLYNRTAYVESCNGGVFAECGYYMSMFLTNFVDDKPDRPEIYMDKNVERFEMRAAPGRVWMGNNAANLSGFTADIIVRPFKIHFD